MVVSGRVEGFPWGRKLEAGLRRRVQFGTTSIGQIVNGRLDANGRQWGRFCRAPVSSAHNTTLQKLLFCELRRSMPTQETATCAWVALAGQWKGPGKGPERGKETWKRLMGVWMEHGCSVVGRRFEEAKEAKMILLIAHVVFFLPYTLVRAYEYGGLSLKERTRGRRQLLVCSCHKLQVFSCSPQKKNGSCTSPITNVLEQWIVPSGTAAAGGKSTHKCGQARAQAMPACVLFQKKKEQERTNRHEASTKKGEATPRGKGKKR